MQQDYLSLEHISKSFGGNRALNDVSFSVRKGTVHVLAGENGAGKSTVLKILAGIYHRDEGDIFLDGRKVEIETPQQAAANGIAMVFQELTLISELTVEENLFLSIEPRGRFGMIDKKTVRSRVIELMNTYNIQIEPTAIAGRLSIAQQQMAEILKILLRDPQIIILDEPTSSLATEEVKTLFNIVRTLVQKGKTIIFISHRMEEIFEIGDYITVFKDGEVVATSKISEIDAGGLVKMMVGRSLSQIYPRKAERVGDEVLLKVDRLKSEILKNVSFELHRGEVLGIAGLQGHGQTELLNAISGLHPLSAGEIEINGKKVRIRNAGQALKNGIALVPSDRKREGLMLMLSIRQNLALCSLKERSKGGFIQLKAEEEFARETQEELKIKLASLNNSVSSLSGGNQQKVVLGKELGTHPKVMLFNDPTRGIDVGSKSDFYNIMRSKAGEGVGIILCSSDMMEVIGMSDRVIVMYEGEITGILSGEELTEENIMCLAMGITGKQKK